MAADSSFLAHFFFGTLHAIVLSAMYSKSQVSLESQLIFYAAYHQHPVNVAIHVVFIPMIWWTLIIMACHFPLMGIPMQVPGTTHDVTWGTTGFLGYALYYVWLDKLMGSLCSVLLFAMYLLAAHLAAKARAEGAPEKRKTAGLEVWQWAFILQVFAWYMQIHPGHMVYEGVKPALMDSLGDALTAAPFFSFYDVVWTLFPNTAAGSLQSRVAVGVLERRLAMCAANPSLRFCSQLA